MDAMMKTGVHHVIMAGGSGTRFWPVSRAARPKQFLSLVGDQSLIRQAHDRAASLSGPERVWVSAGRSHESMIMRAVPGFDAERFIAEPCARNTAACVGLAALHVGRVDPEAVMVMAPADHVYTRPDVLAGALSHAVEAARSADCLVTLGIKPARAETGYGYIEVDESEDESPIRKVSRFHEKPDSRTAAEYLAAGHFLWNSGIFIWRVGAIMKAIEICAPGLWTGLKRIEAAIGSQDEERVLQETFGSFESISVDYAVLERAHDVRVVPTDPGWSDVGSWDTVADLCDTEGRDVAGDAGRVFALDSSNCFVYSDENSARLVSLVGVDDLIVVDSGDALLICRKGASQSVRDVVERLKKQGRNDLL